MNVAFLIFNRPDLTKRVFAEIRRARPERLFVVADGPRNNHLTDAEKVVAVRSVVDRVDWPCKVERNYSDVNLGCKRRVSSGLDWVFQNVEEAIILEDDCLPHPDFFRYCVELLDRYRNDERIGHICGMRPDMGMWTSDDSYVFSRYTLIWGWATWRRAWGAYDVEMHTWPAIKASRGHYDMFSTGREAKYFELVWDSVYRGQFDTWDMQWFLACLIRNVLAVRPTSNLVVNCGFRTDATHTSDPCHPVAMIQSVGLTWPLRHPVSVLWNPVLDRHLVRFMGLNRESLLKRTVGTLRNRYFYGRILRSIPLVGHYWSNWRQGHTKSEEKRMSE